MEIICARCKKNCASGYTMSMFNTDTICSKCKEIETKHPQYKLARDTEAKAVINGNYNFPGIGLPADYDKFMQQNMSK